MPYKNTHTNPNTTFIYTLQSGDEIRYVGKSDNPRARMFQHKTTSGFKNPHLHRWMKKRGDVVLSVVDEVPKSEWIFWEKWYIQLFKYWGFNLVNLTEGGDGLDGCVYDKELAEQKRRASRIYASGENSKMYGLKGENHPAFGSRHTVEAKKKMSEVQKRINSFKIGEKGVSHSEETIKKCSEIKKKQWDSGVYNTEEYREKMRLLATGRPQLKTRKPIKSNKTGEVFESIEAAALSILGNKKGGGNIVSQLKGKLKTAYGHTFSYV